jgi:hypothetical protein
MINKNTTVRKYYCLWFETEDGLFFFIRDLSIARFVIDRIF